MIGDWLSELIGRLVGELTVQIGWPMTDSVFVVHARRGMSEIADELETRTMRFALDVCELINDLEESGS